MERIFMRIDGFSVGVTDSWVAGRPMSLFSLHSLGTNRVGNEGTIRGTIIGPL